MSPVLKLRADQVEWRTLEGRIVAVDLRTRQVMETNRTGAFIWNALVAGSTHEELLSGLRQGHDLSVERATGDVDAFLAMLRSADLLDEGA